MASIFEILFKCRVMVCKRLPPRADYIIKSKNKFITQSIYSNLGEL